MTGPTRDSVISDVRKVLERELARYAGDGRRIQLWAPVGSARAVVDALRSEGKDVRVTYDDLLGWDVAAALGSRDFAVITVQPRRCVYANTGQDFWD